MTKSTAGMPLTAEIVLGKHVWERHSCINCQTVRGEGPYFAPELTQQRLSHPSEDGQDKERKFSALIHQLQQPDGVL
jgi:nitric oxide reductase large subunit